MNSSTRYAFLICSERGGSNLILRMVDSHPEFIGPGATHLIRIFLRNGFRYGDLSDDNEWERFIRHVVDVFKSNELHWNTLVSMENLLDTLSERSLSSVVDHIYSEEAACQGKKGVFIKEIAAYHLIPYFTTHFPGCRFVYQVRDPRDVALSWKNRDWWWACGETAGIRHAARVWKQDQEVAMQRYCELRDTGDIVILRYEDLLADPTLTLHRVCDCLGVAYSERMLDFYQSKRSKEDSEKRTVFKNLSKPLQRGNCGKFVEGLTPEESMWIESWCEREMCLLGYEPYYEKTLPFERIDKLVAEQEAERLAKGKDVASKSEMANSKARIELLKSISAQDEMPLLDKTALPLSPYSGGR